MKFWSGMAEKAVLALEDIFMIGDSTETSKPKHITISKFLTFLGLNSDKSGNLIEQKADGKLGDSGIATTDVVKKSTLSTDLGIDNIDNYKLAMILEKKIVDSGLSVKTIPSYSYIATLTEGFHKPGIPGIYFQGGLLYSVTQVGYTRTAITDSGVWIQKYWYLNEVPLWSAWEKQASAADLTSAISTALASVDVLLAEKENKIFYVNKHSSTYSPNSIAFYIEPTTKDVGGTAVFINLLNTDGTIKNITEDTIISFWLCNIFKVINGADVRQDISVTQNLAVCVRYNLNGVLTKSNVCMRNATGTYVWLKVKDVWGKQSQVMISGNRVTALGVAIEDEIVTTPTPVPDTTITLNATTPTYTVSALTAATVGLIAETTGCSVLLSSLDADQSATFVIDSDSQTITFTDQITSTSKTYLKGDTVFCVYDLDTDAWSINNTLAPVVTDYSDVTANYLIKNTITYKKTGYYAIYVLKTLIPDTLENRGKTLFLPEKLLYQNQTLDAHAIYEPAPGLYYIVDIDQSVGTFTATHNRVIFKQLVSPTTLNIVRAYQGNTTETGAWINEYDGSNISSVKFERLADKANSSDIAAKTEPVTFTVTNQQSDFSVDSKHSLNSKVIDLVLFDKDGYKVETANIFQIIDENNAKIWFSSPIVGTITGYYHIS